ncbi:MAG: FliA/WhiG family RNA polymerase sigma factor [Candidatus Kapabacteria bacterium]|nr:FliA/WhiG family RNA polymerase sigma factor [Candidatus Kapabacteria bacterium]MBX7156065.1 FliA/WhiG family RNA polymerase sigma factor [Bacteroidota bacterium]
MIEQETLVEAPSKLTIPEKELQRMWKDFYRKNQSAFKKSEAKRRLMMHYMWLVRYTLHTMTLPTNAILNDEDFLHIGILGLSEAIERFEPERGIKFETFAIPRVRGIVLDELRRLDWLSRTARKKVHELVAAADQLRSETGREVSAEEIRVKLNVTHEEYQTYLSAAAAAVASLSMNESKQSLGLSDDGDERDILQEIPDMDAENPLTRMADEERMGFLMNYLQNLPERKRLVVTLYYYENLTFKEIGVLLNLTESRICQIHTQVCNDLRDKLNVFDNE